MATTRREFLKSSAGTVCAWGLATPGHAADGPPAIDCHTHFYDPKRPQGVPWPDRSDSVLYRTVLPQQFLEQAAPLGITRTVVVEASPWVEDNAWLLDLAAASRAIVGVVGNLAPGATGFAQHLDRFAANPLFRGIRVNQPAIHAGLEQPGFVADLRRLAERGLGLDVNGGPALLADVPRLAEKVPDLRIVINHLTNHDIDGGPPPREWWDGMRAAARHERVFCKVSALVEHAKPGSGGAKVPVDVAFYRPELDVVWDAFGDERLLYGSNWPVSDRFAPYATVYAIVRQYVEGRGRSAAEKFFGGNALVAYRLPRQES